MKFRPRLVFLLAAFLLFSGPLSAAPKKGIKPLPPVADSARPNMQILNEDGTVREIVYFDSELAEEAEEEPVALTEKEPSADEVDQIGEELEKEALDPLNISFHESKSKIVNLVTWGHKKELREKIVEIMQKLQIKGDPSTWTVHLTPNPYPNGSVSTKPGPVDLSLTLGAFALANNEDELASLIAHEMAHKNPEQLAAPKNTKDIEAFLKKNPGFAKLSESQREEVRADLAGILRLIEAGYNPLAYYDFEERLAGFKTSTKSRGPPTKGSWAGSFLESILSHPKSELRMAIEKAFIVSRTEKKDLTPNLHDYTPFSASLERFRTKTRIYAAHFTTNIPKRIYWGIGAAGALWAAGAFDGRLLEHAKHLYEQYQNYRPPVHEAASQVEPHEGGKFVSFVSEKIAQIYNHYVNLKTVLGTAAATAAAAVARSKYYWNIIVPRDEKAKVYKAYTKALEMQASVERWRKETEDLEKVESGTIVDILDRIERLTSLEKEIVRVYHDGTLISNLELDPIWKSVIKARDGVIDLFGAKIALIPESERTPYLLRLSRIAAKQRSLTHDQRERLTKILEPILPDGKALLDEYKYNPKSAQEEYYNAQVRKKRAEKIGRGQKIKEDAKLILDSLSLRKLAARSDTLTPAELANLVFDLYETGNQTLARDLTAKHYKAITDFIFSPENKSAAMKMNFGQILLTMSLIKDGKMSPEQFTQAIAAASTGEIGHATQIGRMVTERATAQRAGIEKNNPLKVKYALQDQAFRNRLGSFKTVSEIHSYIETEMRPGGVPLGGYKPAMFEYVRAHPELIQTPDDIENLFKEDIFWPDVNRNNDVPGSIGASIRDTVGAFIDKFPETWKYEPAAAEALHRLILDKLKDFGREPKTASEKIALWKRLTSRGVSSVSDALFAEAQAGLTESQIEKYDKVALDEGRIWEAETRNKIIERHIQGSGVYQQLLKQAPGSKREPRIRQVIQLLKDAIPEGGNYYKHSLEMLSRRINSTAEEAEILENAKTEIAQGRKAEDVGIRLASAISDRLLSWSHERQWEFIRFLRGELPVIPTWIQNEFRVLGAARIQRIYSLIPSIEKSVLIDTLLSSPAGLLKGGYEGKIIDHLFQGKSASQRATAKQILSAYMYALRETHTPQLQSYVLSYLLALPPDDKRSIGETLKEVFELFGSTGVKIGQFIAATELLPPEDTKALRGLQSHAREPDRHPMYEDIGSVLGPDETFTLKELLGSASLKYAAKGSLTGKFEDLVFKVLRLEAVEKNNLEFWQLEKMADFLVTEHGPKFGVFRAIVRATKAAVKRELSLKDEIVRSRIARELYSENPSTLAEFEVPHEEVISTKGRDRLVKAKYARGVEFFELSPEDQILAAKAILEKENSILFGAKDKFYFDPDRHPGNYRIEVTTVNGVKKIKIFPIDFGQLSEITRETRDNVVDLFALAQILREVGPADYPVNEIARRMGLTAAETKKFRKAIGNYFPNTELRRPTAYFSVLAALDDIGHTPDIVYFDFARGIVQLSQYESVIPAGEEFVSPVKTMAAEVEARIREHRPHIRPGYQESARLGVHVLMNDPKGFIHYCRDMLARRAGK